ncbi:hypothetical protein AB0C89_21180, partial [Streptomyces sp. NPDC048491]
MTATLTLARLILGRLRDRFESRARSLPHRDGRCANPHFVGIHALRLLPLLAMGLTALAPRFAHLGDDRVRLRLVLLASGAYAGAIVLVPWQAKRKRFLLQPDGLTLGPGILNLAAVALQTYESLRIPTRSTEPLSS